MRICVLGAGIVGLATAWQLRQQGHDVTVIDRTQPGCGASGGNGAQLSYSYVAPLADPGIWGQLPKLLLAADSPLKLRPRLGLVAVGPALSGRLQRRHGPRHHGATADPGRRKPRRL